MLYGPTGHLLQPTEHRATDPVFDPRVETSGYELPQRRDAMPEFRENLAREIEHAEGRMDSADLAGVHLDAFINELTGIGTSWGDKTLGGRPGGPVFGLWRRSGIEAEARQRGSDLGNNIVVKIPDEMTREGWDVEVQPSDEDAETAADPRAQMDASLTAPRRAAAAWRTVARARRADGRSAALASLHAARWDAFAADPSGAPPPAPPVALPKVNDEGIELSEAMGKWADRVGLVRAVTEALRYERAFGGGAVFIGVDDGETDLTRPLDPSRVRAVTHLTAFTGGWDGECVMWRPYNDPRHPKYGLPEIYQVRNTNVQLARPPAPGETRPVSQIIPLGPTGPTIFYVHESRFLIFDGEPVSRQARQEMRGWGDSVFTRVNEVLAQFEQTWNAVAIIMQEFSVATLAIKGLSNALATKGPEARAAFLQYARFQAIVQSVARMRFVDADEQFTRVTASVAGVAELLDKMNLRIAAASDTPTAILFGQNAGGLGDADSTALRGFYDKIRSKQERRLRPELERLYRIAWCASDSPTKGVEPKRWALVFRPLWQPTALEQADLRLKVTQADQIAIQEQVVTPEEVAAKRYGGAEFDPGPIVLDLEARGGAASEAAASGKAGDGGVALTATAQSAIVRVNEARGQIGLGPLLLPSGAPDPDGDLTVAEFTAKRAATVATAAAAESGTLPGTPPEIATPPASPARSGAPRPAAPPPTVDRQAAAKAATAASDDPNRTSRTPPAPVFPGPVRETPPPMTAMPSDPSTGDPQSTPSEIRETGAGGRPLERRPQTPGRSDDEQARVPAGQPGGGEFAPTGSGGRPASKAEHAAARHLSKKTGQKVAVGPGGHVVEGPEHMKGKHIGKAVAEFAVKEGIGYGAKAATKKAIQVAASAAAEGTAAATGAATAAEVGAGLLAPEVVVPVLVGAGVAEVAAHYKIPEKVVGGAEKIGHALAKRLRGARSDAEVDAVLAALEQAIAAAE